MDKVIYLYRCEDCCAEYEKLYRQKSCIDCGSFNLLISSTTQSELREREEREEWARWCAYMDYSEGKCQ